MRISEFIRANRRPIIVEWETFARSFIPAAADMSPLALRDHVSEIIDFIVVDMDLPQTISEQFDKSQGQKVRSSQHTAAEVHAYLRHAGGFDLDQMVSEFRALRASVTKLWKAQATDESDAAVADLIRFNETIDQELTESIGIYARTLERSRSLFLGILGHDLRNPLGAVTMSAELSLRIGGLSERQTMLMTQILESTSRVAEIVDTLLDLTRARLGSGFPVIRGTADMAYIGRLMIDEMQSMHPQRRFTLEISGAMEGEWDKPRLGQVFSNLLGNAVQHGFADSPIAVTITGSVDDVSICVHSYGVPISPDAIGFIFEALDRGGAEGGERDGGPTNLGLGLYITKSIVAAHGGEVSVSSSEGQGTTFTARFPRQGSRGAP